MKRLVNFAGLKNQLFIRERLQVV